MKTTIINNTFYGDYFPEDIQDIYLLEKEEGVGLWKSFIDSKAKNFFQLEDNNSIIKDTNYLGDWRSFYDKGDIIGLGNLLTTNLSWDKEDVIYFCINRDNIIKTTVEIFLENSFNFLEMHDDCPIVINMNNGIHKYMYFAPLGGIFGVNPDGADL